MSADYDTFVTDIAEAREAWVLARGDGRAVVPDDQDEEKQLVVLWADDEAAKGQATDDWSVYEPEPLPVHRLLELSHDEERFALLYDDEANFLDVPAAKLRDDLLDALDAQEDDDEDQPREASEQEVQGVRQAPDDKRLDYFIGQAADWGEVWSVKPDGDTWGSLNADDGTSLFPVWPSAPFIRDVLTDDWESAEPAPIEIHLFLEFCRTLKERGDRVAVLLTPEGDYVGVAPDELAENLRTALDAVQ